MNVKINNSENGIILAVCDDELVGNYFSEGEKQLDLRSEFYNGEKKSDGETADLMRNAYIIHLVGEKSCSLAVREGILNYNEIKKVVGIPHAQVIIVE